MLKTKKKENTYSTLDKTLQKALFGDFIGIAFKKQTSSIVSKKKLRSISKRAFSNMKLEGQDIGEKETLKLAKSVIEGMGYTIVE